MKRCSFGKFGWFQDVLRWIITKAGKNSGWKTATEKILPRIHGNRNQASPIQGLLILSTWKTSQRQGGFLSSFFLRPKKFVMFKTYENLTCSNPYNRKLHVQNGGCSMAIWVGCLKSDSPVQGQRKARGGAVRWFGRLGQGRRKKRTCWWNKDGKMDGFLKRWWWSYTCNILLVYLILCLFILFNESIQMGFGSGLMRKINAKSNVETVFVSQRDG